MSMRRADFAQLLIRATKWQQTPCCMDQPRGRSDRGGLSVLCNADVAGASQLQHAVEDVDSNCHLGCLTLVGVRAQRVTDYPFPAADIGFHQRTPLVPRRFLPTHAAMFRNYMKMLVTRC